MSSILYCGMANDIMAPLLLVPDFKKLYAISKFDKCYASEGTFTSQREDIKQILLNGSDKNNAPKRKTWNLFPGRDRNHFLHDKSTILKETINKEKKRWYLKFEYLGQIKEMIYYYRRDCLTEWPNDVKNIRHLMFQGSLSADEFSAKEYRTFRQMMKERCSFNFLAYGLWFDHKHYGFNIKIAIRDGHQGDYEDGTEIAVKAITTDKINDFLSSVDSQSSSSDEDTVSSQEHPLCDFCDNHPASTRCTSCEHHVCDGCCRRCPICQEYVCEPCDRDLEELVCNKCGDESCLHGHVVGYDYLCVKEECNGEAVNKNMIGKKKAKK